MQQDSETRQRRISITRQVMQVLCDWSLSASQQAEVLAMPQGTRSRHMHQYKEDEPFPEHPELDVRVEHILGIADALRTSYPRNLEMGAYWMRQANKKRFNNRAPLQCILDDGLEGLLAVRIHLDCAYDWHIDQQKHSS